MRSELRRCARLGVALLMALPLVCRADFDGAVALYNAQDYAKAFPAMAPFARDGNSVAQGALGAMLSEGKGVAADPTEAARWLRLAALKGDAVSQQRLGAAYFRGIGVAKDWSSGIYWLQEASRNDNADALDTLKQLYAVFTAPSNQAIGEAQTVAGLIEYAGFGATKNKAAAALHFRQAARLGDGQGCNNLAVMLLRGDGVEQDTAEAIKWFKRAADKGITLAMLNLSALEAIGQAVSPNRVEAIDWIARAAALNDGKALYIEALMRQVGSGVPQDLQGAIARLRAASLAGNPAADAMLGILYSKGEGLPKDRSEFARWTLRAADQGDMESQAIAALLYDKGFGLPKSAPLTAQWWRAANRSKAALAARSQLQVEAGLSIAKNLDTIALLDEVDSTRPELHRERVLAAERIVLLQREGISEKTLGFDCKVPDFPDHGSDAVERTAAMAARYEQCVSAFAERVKQLTDTDIAPETRLMTTRELARLADRRREALAKVMERADANIDEAHREMARAQAWADEMQAQREADIADRKASREADLAAQRETVRWLRSIGDSFAVVSQTLRARTPTPIDRSEFYARIAAQEEDPHSQLNQDRDRDRQRQQENKAADDLRARQAADRAHARDQVRAGESKQRSDEQARDEVKAREATAKAEADAQLRARKLREQREQALAEANDRRREEARQAALAKEKAAREAAEKAAADKAQRDKADYLRNYAAGTRLKAIACYGETSVVGVAPRIHPEVVGCVDVHYRAQCEGSAQYVDGIANTFVGMGTGCFGDTYRVDPKPACPAERVRVTVREARPCKG